MLDAHCLFVCFFFFLIILDAVTEVWQDLGEREGVQTSICFHQSVWKTLFPQTAALVTIGTQCISQSGMTES